jgi:CCR4-NOT transcription complex subunit 10
MESRDLTSSSPSSTTNRDSPSSTEPDDAVFALAKDATVHYQSGNFVQCVHVMNQILQKKPKDPKVTNQIRSDSVFCYSLEILDACFVFIYWLIGLVLIFFLFFTN